MRPIFQTK